MVRLMKESIDKSEIVFVARLDDGKAFYSGKLDDGFKWILKREMNKFWTVEDTVVRYLKSCGYVDVDEFSDDELAVSFIDEFLDEDGFVFDRYKGFTIEPVGFKPGEGPYYESVKRTRRAKRAIKVNEARIGKTKSVYVSQDENRGSKIDDIADKASQSLLKSMDTLKQIQSKMRKIETNVIGLYLRRDESALEDAYAYKSFLEGVNETLDELYSRFN